jgi:hypothetical protein
VIIEPQKEVYEIGEQIQISTIIRNNSTKEFQISSEYNFIMINLKPLDVMQSKYFCYDYKKPPFQTVVSNCPIVGTNTFGFGSILYLRYSKGRFKSIPKDFEIKRSRIILLRNTGVNEINIKYGSKTTNNKYYEYEDLRKHKDATDKKHVFYKKILKTNSNLWRNEVVKRIKINVSDKVNEEVFYDQYIGSSFDNSKDKSLLLYNTFRAPFETLRMYKFSESADKRLILLKLIIDLAKTPGGENLTSELYKYYYKTKAWKTEPEYFTVKERKILVEFLKSVFDGIKVKRLYSDPYERKLSFRNIDVYIYKFNDEIKGNLSKNFAEDEKNNFEKWNKLKYPQVILSRSQENGEIVIPDEIKIERAINEVVDTVGRKLRIKKDKDPNNIWE